MINENPQNATFKNTDSGILQLIGKDLGDYHIVRLLAKGGMGIVYEAEQILLKRKVALKILPKDLINEYISLERFQHEAQSVANLHHPNIVQVYQFAGWQNCYFFAMEFIEGKTLEEILRLKKVSANKEAIPLNWALDIIIQVLKALDYAHGKGVIHRDIKPANIMIDISGRVFLTDFGLAKNQETEKNIEVEGLTLGTPEYMSPEQANGEKLDLRTDIYSMGLILYETLTGDTPYQGDSPVSIIANKIVKENVRRPTELNPDIPPEIERIILKAVAKQRSERFQSAQEMLGALEKFCSEQKISEIVRSTAAKEKAKAIAEIEKEKQKVQAVIMEEKIKASLRISEEKREIKQREIIKLLKISLKAVVFVSMVYLMLFLIYETNLEEDRIKKDVARQIALENKQEIARNMTEESQKSQETDEKQAIPDALKVNQDMPEIKPVAPTPADENKNGVSRKELDWIQTQLQLGKNYEYVERLDLAIESYMKVIKKYPGTQYAEYARQHISSLSQRSKK